NLPFGVFRRAGEDARVGVAIGDQILDLRAASLLDASNLNVLMAQGRDAVQALRRTISDLLRAGAPPMPRVLVPMDDVEMLLPASIGDYTDFYASLHHATNVGSMFRPDNPLLPNWKHLPVGYHGRASSVVVSGTPIRRPMGQISKADDAPPIFASTGSLDYEAEVGVFIATNTELGSRVPVSKAWDSIFGVTLVNDW